MNVCIKTLILRIDLIPDILKRFRIYFIGIAADIQKTFWVLTVMPKDRDFLVFYFPCSEGQLIYGHRRVVFGVSSSSYLLNASIMHMLEDNPPEYKETAEKFKYLF